MIGLLTSRLLSLGLPEGLARIMAWSITISAIIVAVWLYGLLRYHEGRKHAEHAMERAAAEKRAEDAGANAGATLDLFHEILDRQPAIDFAGDLLLGVCDESSLRSGTAASMDADARTSPGNVGRSETNSRRGSPVAAVAMWQKAYREMAARDLKRFEKLVIQNNEGCRLIEKRGLGKCLQPEQDLP